MQFRVQRSECKGQSEPGMLTALYSGLPEEDCTNPWRYAALSLTWGHMLWSRPLKTEGSAGGSWPWPLAVPRPAAGWLPAGLCERLRL